MPADTYLRPGVFTTRVFNPVVAFLARRLGLSMKGAHVLSVQGRKTGEWHSTPVNLLSIAGQRYLVAPRGETQWVRNIRVSREARLTLGRRTETVHVVEVPDREKAPILRAYLKEWAWEVSHPSTQSLESFRNSLWPGGRPSSAPCSACSGGGRVGLPDGEDVPLGVRQLREPPHSRHWPLRRDDLGSEPLRSPDELVDTRHADVVDRSLAREHPAHEPTVDAWADRLAIGVGRDGSHHPVFGGLAPARRAPPPADLPAEQLTIELRRPLGFVSRDFEMNDRVIHGVCPPVERCYLGRGVWTLPVTSSWHIVERAGSRSTDSAQMKGSQRCPGKRKSAGRAADHSNCPSGPAVSGKLLVCS